VIARRNDGVDVVVLDLADPDRHDLPTPVAGQHLDLRVDLPDGGRAPVRSYSIAGASGGRYRLAVKREGAASARLQQTAQVGTRLRCSAPRGAFALAPGDGPVALVSAGIGVSFDPLPLLRQVVLRPGDAECSRDPFERAARDRHRLEQSAVGPQDPADFLLRRRQLLVQRVGESREEPAQHLRLVTEPPRVEPNRHDPVHLAQSRFEEVQHAGLAVAPRSGDAHDEAGGVPMGRDGTGDRRAGEPNGPGRSGRRPARRSAR
jgi:hypothetical protein